MIEASFSGVIEERRICETAVDCAPGLCPAPHGTNRTTAGVINVLTVTKLHEMSAFESSKQEAFDDLADSLFQERQRLESFRCTFSIDPQARRRLSTLFQKLHSPLKSGIGKAAVKQNKDRWDRRCDRPYLRRC